MEIHTIGHSTRPLDEFVSLLERHAIGAIADVRRFPASRRHPHFARDALAGALDRAGIAYAWFEALGGRRPARPDSPHVALRSASFRGYADHMESPEFQAALDALLAFARARRTALLCAEAVPWRCHRQLLADRLLAAGATVHHVLSPQAPRAHRLSPMARLEGERVVYDRGGQLVLDTP